MHHLFGKHSLRLISKYWWFWSIWRTAAYISYVFEIRDSVEPPWMSGVDRFHDNVMIRFISAWIIKVESTLWLPWAANISKACPGLIHKINLAAKAKRRKSMKFKMKALTAVDPRSGSFFFVGWLFMWNGNKFVLSNKEHVSNMWREIEGQSVHSMFSLEFLLMDSRSLWYEHISDISDMLWYIFLI